MGPRLVQLGNCKSCASGRGVQPAQAGRARMAQPRIGAAGLRQLVGQIQRGQHGHAQRVHGAALRGHGAHLRVHRSASSRNVLRVLAGEVIGLVVDLNGDVPARIAADCSSAMPATSQFQRVQLRQQPLHALPHLVALGAQRAHFLLQLLGQRRLLAQLRLGLRWRAPRPSARACRSRFTRFTARRIRSSSAEKSSTLNASALDSAPASGSA
jgi:hypothetical protein